MRSKALLLTLCLAPAGVSAQSDSLTRLLDSLPNRARVRIQSDSGVRFFGRYLGRTQELMTVSAPHDTGRSVRLTEVDMLWRQRGTNVKSGALVGATLGAIGFGWLAWEFSKMDDSADPCQRWCAFGRGSAGGAVFGVVMGAGVGALVPRWRPVYP